MNVEFPLIEIEGSPEERGIQYGEKAKALIHRSGEIYQGVMAGYGCSWDNALNLAEQYTPYIKNHSNELYEELKGIAKGAGIALEVIIIINGRSELLQGYDWKTSGNKSGMSLDDGCTSLLAMPDVTERNHLIHAQNWDWYVECLENTIVLRVKPEHGPTVLTYVEAGGLARCGMNSAGITITGNYLESDIDFDRTGIPLSVIRRQVLQSNNLHGALSAIIKSPRAVSNNMLVSSTEDCGVEAINLETSPEDIYFLYPENGVLSHPNHFESMVARIKLKDTGLGSSLCSLYRGPRLRRFLEQKAGSITINDFKAALADRFGAPHGICRSPVTENNGGVTMTVATIIMDTKAQEMHVCKSPYNNEKYFTYSVESG